MKKENLYLFLLSSVFLLASVVFFGKSSNMLIDFSREAFVPYQMLSGQKLFSDIFLIYGFFGYFVNFLIYKVSPNINFLLLEANLIAFMILFFFYFSLKKVINSTVAFISSIFLIFASIFSSSAFSFVVPYSYSTLWAIFSIFGIMFSLLYKKESLLYLLLGLLFVSKIEYFLFAFLGLVLIKIVYKEKVGAKIFLSLIFPCFFVFYIFFNKIAFGDILNNFSYIKTMVSTDAIKFMYASMGTFFKKGYFITNLLHLGVFFFVSFLSYILYKKNYKTISIIIFIVLTCFLNLTYAFNLSFFVLIFVFLYLFKADKITKEDVILLIFSLILSSKSIFALNNLNYANSGFCLCLVLIYYYFSKIFDKKILFIQFLTVASVFVILNISNILKAEKTLFNTHHGAIYLSRNEYNLFKRVNHFIKHNIKENETLLVVPEGQIINFINGKKWEYFNYSFLPLDFQTFKEEKLIKDLEKNQTDYILFYPRNTVEYGAKAICYDYAVDFCLYIADNYDRVEIFEDNFKALIFKKKKYEK